MWRPASRGAAAAPRTKGQEPASRQDQRGLTAVPLGQAGRAILVAPLALGTTLASVARRPPSLR
jgi:hypothetical protein